MPAKCIPIARQLDISSRIDLEASIPKPPDIQTRFITRVSPGSIRQNKPLPHSVRRSHRTRIIADFPPMLKRRNNRKSPRILIALQVFLTESSESGAGVPPVDAVGLRLVDLPSPAPTKRPPEKAGEGQGEGALPNNCCLPIKSVGCPQKHRQLVKMRSFCKKERRSSTLRWISKKSPESGPFVTESTGYSLDVL